MEDCTKKIDIGEYGPVFFSYSVISLCL